MTQTKSVLALLLAIPLLAIVPGVSPAQEPVDIFADPENLKVLPEDISSESLSETMKGFATGLGARCETCHVGEPNTPLETFDFASDEKTMKRKARLMIQMLDEINGDLVPRLDEVERASRVSVRCVTCHRGQTKPNMIEDVLNQQLADNGLDAALAEYKSLRDEFYGSHSYDFSEYVLPMYTQELAEKGLTTAAIELARTNAENYPDSYYTAFVLGELYAATEQNELAISSFTRAIELNPGAERFLGPKLQRLRGN